jgi:hypothetical protein
MDVSRTCYLVLSMVFWLHVRCSLGCRHNYVFYIEYRFMYIAHKSETYSLVYCYYFVYMYLYVVAIKAVLSSFKKWFGDGGKSLYKYYQNMYVV